MNATTERGTIAPRSPSLDGIRGVGIILVLFHHFDMQVTTPSTVARVGHVLMDRPGSRCSWCRPPVRA